ncbi:hypothetical protein [Microcoleus sp. OTE_8_concoct_300]|uniref:hypothetical protein n=1 Tax=Microcoleus sp. OTE_8_concoct_300 TaxID=2964710 RepID=UPI00403F5627
MYLHQGEIFKVVNLCWSKTLPIPNTGFLTLKEHETGIKLADKNGHFAVAEAASLGIHICPDCYVVYGKIIAQCNCEVK